MSIYIYVSDTPATITETDKARSIASWQAFYLVRVIKIMFGTGTKQKCVCVGGGGGAALAGTSEYKQSDRNR